VGVAGLLLAIAAMAFAQTAGPEFEVASVKAVVDAAPNAQMTGYIDRGKVVIHNARLRQMIGVAWGVQGARVEKGPGWIDIDRYEIEAKAEDAAASEATLKLMLRRLLEDRFQLRLHTESRMLPSYTLLVGRDGARLQAAKEGERTNCALSAGLPRSELVCVGTQVLGLVNALSNMLGSPVVDKTGLAGNYDFTLAWDTGNPDFAAILPEAAEALGLRIEVGKTRADVIVVDGAERASQN
jgi:uncharacterized protein (TIGR03435 family)